MAKKKKEAAAKKKSPAKPAPRKKKPKISGYDVIEVPKVGTIDPGQILYIEVPCPKGKVILGGGAWCEDLPPGSATNYVLKSSWPVKMGDGSLKWMAVWTNTSDSVHPQVVRFKAYAIVADA